MSRWGRGAAEVDGYVAQGELERVEASVDLADRLCAEAQQALDSAESIKGSDPSSAYTLSYDASRKAATSLLAAQGLRPTAAGGHRVVHDAVAAQFDGPFNRFNRFRRQRHDVQYPTPTSVTVTQGDVEAAIAFGKDCVDAARRLLDTGQIEPW